MPPYSARRFAAVTALAGVWLAMLGGDWRALSNAEQDMQDVVARLPRGARVVAAIETPPARVAPLAHALDRACVGTCFSWGNYEPPSGAFRVRAGAGNAFVVSRLSDFAAIEQGAYRVPPLPFPLWIVHPCRTIGRAVSLCASPARTGDIVRAACLDPLAAFTGLHPSDRCVPEGRATR